MSETTVRQVFIGFPVDLTPGEYFVSMDWEFEADSFTEIFTYIGPVRPGRHAKNDVATQEYQAASET